MGWQVPKYRLFIKKKLENCIDISTLLGYDGKVPTGKSSMTDGPFRNAPLHSRWKKFGDVCKSDARSPKERADYAEHALRKDIWSKSFLTLVRDVDKYIKGPQNDLLPKYTIDTIFAKHERSLQSDMLQRYFKANSDRPMMLSDAWNLAVDETIRHQVSLTRNRIEEHFIAARSRGDVSYTDMQKCIKTSREAFDGVNASKMRIAGLGDKSPIRISVQKLDGVEAGPPEQ